MADAKVAQLGYNATTQEYTEYAPISSYADGHAIAVRVQEVFCAVRCIVHVEDCTIFCISANAQDARSASWFACGLSAGAASAKEFRL